MAGPKSVATGPSTEPKLTIYLVETPLGNPFRGAVAIFDSRLEMQGVYNSNLARFSFYPHSASILILDPPVSRLILTRSCTSGTGAGSAGHSAKHF